MVIPAAILSLIAPLFVLVMGAFAANKVMGVAISKGFGIVLMGPIIDYIVPEGVKWIGAYSPVFWIERAYFSTTHIQFMIYSAVALVYSAFAAIWLYKRFSAKIG
ncbi:MAG: hypothetical protein R2727_03830 [Bacteroidales bacterium]